MTANNKRIVFGVEKRRMCCVIVVILNFVFVGCMSESPSSVKTNKVEQSSTTSVGAVPESNGTSPPRELVVASDQTKQSDVTKQPDAIQVGKIGETLNLDSMTYTVEEAWWTDELFDFKGIARKADRSFLVLRVRIRFDKPAVDSKSTRSGPSCRLIDDKGATILPAGMASIIPETVYVALKSGETLHGLMVFDLEKGRSCKLELLSGFSNPVKVGEFQIVDIPNGQDLIAESVKKELELKSRSSTLISMNGLTGERTPSRPREWKSADGKFAVEASFVKMEKGKVTLKRTSDGHEITVDVSSLGGIEQALLGSDDSQLMP